MPTPRSEMAAAVVEGRIYVPGGFGGRSTLEIYDPQRDTWTRGADLPDGRDHASVTAVDGMVYVVGGNEGSTGLLAYDPVMDAWDRRRRMPHPRTAVVALGYQGALWVVGGTSDSVQESELRQVLRYDPLDDDWTVHDSLSDKREHHGAVQIDDEFWLFGGRDGLASDPSMEIYSPLTGVSRTGPSMAAGRGGFQAVKFRGEVVAHSGEQLDETPAMVRSSEALGVGSDTWSAALELPIAVHGHAAVVADDVLFIIGGSDFAGGVDNAGRVWALR